MGWTYHHGPLRHESPVDYFRREFTCDGERFRSTVLDAATVEGAVYAAIRCQDHRSGADYVYCKVILFRNNAREGFGYKDMCETSGPHEADCPDRIMRLLSPVEQIPSACQAAIWRQRVAETASRRRAAGQLAAQLKPGVVIRLEREARFGRSGIAATEFRLRYVQKRTPVFEPINHPGFLCRLHQRMLGTATIVPASRVEPAAAEAHEPERRLL